MYKSYIIYYLCKIKDIEIAHFYRIDTVRQFLEANLSWGHMRPVPYWPDYFDLEVRKNLC